MISADDLQVFLEVARKGRLTEAAKVLQINHTTVSRHISRLEQATDGRLFDRRHEGWTLTEAGLRLLVHAETVESAVKRAEEECLGEEHSVSGDIRLIVPEGLGTYRIAPGLGALKDRHPGLRFEVITSNRHASLAPREFDLAITIQRPQTRAVAVKKLADYTLNFYASTAYLAARSPITAVEDLYEHDLIWYADDALDQGTHSQLYKVAPAAAPYIRTNNVTGQIEAARRGLGICLIPSFIGQDIQGLEQIPVPAPPITRSYWISAQKELVSISRVRIMLDYMMRITSDIGPGRPGGPGGA